jgi:hypothetical protein
MMFGRMFGRGKDESDQAVCAECGRTLLAGEWTQKVVGADGEEVLICSLCGQTHALSGAEPVAASPTPANNGRVRETREDVGEPRADSRDPRTESDAFWKALKDKDAEIERLQAQLARIQAENQELAGRLARASGAAVPSEPLIPFAVASSPPSSRHCATRRRIPHPPTWRRASRSNARCRRWCSKTRSRSRRSPTR